jgi:hypothetical protein
MTKSKWIVVAALLAVTSGCAGPRIVRSMNSTRDGKFRLLYDRNVGWGQFEQGMVDCKVAEDGSISECQPVNITFVEE